MLVVFSSEGLNYNPKRKKLTVFVACEQVEAGVCRGSEGSASNTHTHTHTGLIPIQRGDPQGQMSHFDSVSL